MKSILKIVISITLLATILFAINAEQFINPTKYDQIIDKQFLKICYDYDLKVATAVSDSFLSKSIKYYLHRVVI